MFIPPIETGINYRFWHIPHCWRLWLCAGDAWLECCWLLPEPMVPMHAYINGHGHRYAPMPFILPVFTHRHTHTYLWGYSWVFARRTHTKHHSTIYIYIYIHRSTDFISPIMLLRTTIYLWYMIIYNILHGLKLCLDSNPCPASSRGFGPCNSRHREAWNINDKLRWPMVPITTMFSKATPEGRNQLGVLIFLMFVW